MHICTYGLPEYDDAIEHHGVKGMHWGIRRYQNYDGTLIKTGSAIRKKTKYTNIDGSLNEKGKLHSRDYICHGDHKYLARVKTAANKYRYFYTQAAYNAYKNAKAVGIGMLSTAKSARDRKRLATTGRRTDVFSEWDEARRKEYKKKVVNPAGPGMGWHALDDWNNMISDFGNAVWKNEHEIYAQPTVDTADALNNYYGRSKSSYRVRPANRKKNVTGKANNGSTTKRPLAKLLTHHRRRKVGNR